jgi:hypothetical protein
MTTEEQSRKYQQKFDRRTKWEPSIFKIIKIGRVKLTLSQIIELLKTIKVIKNNLMEKKNCSL